MKALWWRSCLRTETCRSKSKWFLIQKFKTLSSLINSVFVRVVWTCIDIKMQCKIKKKRKIKIGNMTERRYSSTHSALNGCELTASRTRYFTPEERDPDTHRTGGWVEFTIDLNALEKRKTTWPCCCSTFHRTASLQLRHHAVANSKTSSILHINIYYTANVTGLNNLFGLILLVYNNKMNKLHLLQLTSCCVMML